jgi:hypothetical protein
VSFAHYLQNLTERTRYRSVTREKAIAMLMRTKRPYGGWSRHVGRWRRRQAPTAFVRFEDLIADPIAAIAAGADELGVQLNEPRREAPTFEEMKERSRKPDLLRRGRAEAWRTEFPPHLLDEFWALHGEEMEALGYPRH